MSVKDTLMGNSIKSKTFIREFVAEFFGTFILLTIGNSIIAAYLLKGQNPDPFSVCFGYGVGAMIATLGCGHLSGAHINPAGTLALAVNGKFPWKKVPYYIFAQYLAGFVSSAVIYLVYYDAFDKFDLDKDVFKPESVFTTFPFKHATVRGVLIDQIIGTGMLFFSLQAIGNTKGISMPNFLQAPTTCLLITGCCLAFGLNAGAIFNPARDFTPRVFAALVFGCSRAFDPLDYHYWWSAGIVGPHLGAILGIFLFRIACDHYSEEQEKTQAKSSFRTHLTSHLDDGKRQNESTTSIC